MGSRQAQPGLVKKKQIFKEVWKSVFVSGTDGLIISCAKEGIKICPFR